MGVAIVIGPEVVRERGVAGVRGVGGGSECCNGDRAGAVVAGWGGRRATLRPEKLLDQVDSE